MHTRSVVRLSFDSVNNHAEELRHYFVAHEGKKELVVTREGPDVDRYTVDFGAIARDMSVEIDKHVCSRFPKYETSSSFLKCHRYPIGCRQDPGEMGHPRFHHNYLARCDNLFRTAHVHAEVVCILPQLLLLFLASSSTLIWLCAQLFLI